MHLELLLTVDVPLQFFSFLWDQWLCCLIYRLPLLRLHFHEQWDDAGPACRAVAAVDLNAPQILLQGYQSKGGQWGGQQPRQFLGRFAQPFLEFLIAMSLFTAGEYPRLTLPWLSSSTVSIVWTSQPVLWHSHCPIPFSLSILLFLFYFPFHCDGVFKTAINIRAFKWQLCFL